MKTFSENYENRSEKVNIRKGQSQGMSGQGPDWAGTITATTP